MSQRQAAKVLGVGLATIQRDLTRNGSESDPKRVTADLRNNCAQNAQELRTDDATTVERDPAQSVPENGTQCATADANDLRDYPAPKAPQN